MTRTYVFFYDIKLHFFNFRQPEGQKYGSCAMRFFYCIFFLIKNCFAPKHLFFGLGIPMTFFYLCLTNTRMNQRTSDSDEKIFGMTKLPREVFCVSELPAGNPLNSHQVLQFCRKTESRKTRVHSRGFFICYIPSNCQPVCLVAIEFKIKFLL